MQTAKSFLNGRSQIRTLADSPLTQFAIPLLQNGADIRYAQELLGHESIKTTAGYTKEMIKSL